MSWSVHLEKKIDGEWVTVTETINYTHNCNQMVREAGLPEWPRVGGWKARKLERRLNKVLFRLAANPQKYRVMEPENGWGDYVGLMRVLEDVWKQCRTFPSTRVWMSA